VREPDPDDPAQSRHIDITIRRGDDLAFVECRLHKERQDLQWIEELMGAGRRYWLFATRLVFQDHLYYVISDCGYWLRMLMTAKYGQLAETGLLYTATFEP
jgi:hypothetical protein